MNDMTQFKSLVAAASLALACGCGDVIDGSIDGVVIDSIAPASGPQGGGTLITITGSGFSADDGDHSVAVGDALVPATVDSDTTITFNSPAGESGPVDVTVINFRGSATVPQAFTYNESPVIHAIEPARIPEAGGPITVRGANFSASSANQITIGTAVATDVVVVDDRTMTATAGAIADTPFTPLDVTIDGGDGSTSLTGAAQYSARGLLMVRSDRRIEFASFATGRTGGTIRLPRAFRKLALRPDGTGLAFDGSALYELDLNSNEYDFVGLHRNNVAANLQPGHIIFDASNNPFVFLKRNGGVLANLDPGTAVSTPIGTAAPTIPAPGTPGSCLWENNAGTFFFIGQLSAGLQTMSKSNSSLTPITALTGIPAGFEGCREAAVDGATTYVLLYRRTGARENAIMTLNSTTGELTMIEQFEEAGIQYRTLTLTPDSF